MARVWPSWFIHPMVEEFVFGISQELMSGLVSPCCVTSASCSCCVLAPFSGHCPAQKVTPVAFLWPGYLVVVFSALSFPHSVPGQEGLFPALAGWSWVICVGAPHLLPSALGWLQEKATALGHAGALKVGMLGWEVPFLTPWLGTWSASQLWEWAIKELCGWQPEGRCLGQVQISVQAGGI